MSVMLEIRALQIIIIIIIVCVCVCVCGRKFFMDALPMAGSSGTVDQMMEMMLAGDVTGMEVDMWLASLAFIPEPTADMIQSVTVRHSPVACHCSLYEQPTADMIQSVTVCDSPVACHCSLNSPMLTLSIPSRYVTHL